MLESRENSNPTEEEWVIQWAPRRMSDAFAVQENPVVLEAADRSTPHVHNFRTNIALLEVGDDALSISSSCTESSSEMVSSSLSEVPWPVHSPRRPPPLLACEGDDSERNLHMAALDELAMSFDSPTDGKKTSPQASSSKLWCYAPFRINLRRTSLSLSAWSCLSPPTAVPCFPRKAASAGAVAQEESNRYSLEEDLHALAHDFV